MATSFLGYVLPWSQMSFWAATVITNMIGSIPVIGNSLLLWLWGGFSVSNPTLHRIYVLHFLLPFIMLVLVIFHILYLHEKTSSNPIHNNICESLNLAPYFVIKDFVFFLLFLIPYLYYVLINPDYLSHPDTYIKANPMQTPNHIVPEWYFLIFYTMLRAIPSKLGGILVMAMAIIFLLLLSFFFNSAEFTSPIKTKFIYDLVFWMFLFNCCLLTYLGAKPVEYPYIFYGRLCTFLYFFYLILLILLEKYEIFLFINKFKK